MDYGYNYPLLLELHFQVYSRYWHWSSDSQIHWARVGCIGRNKKAWFRWAVFKTSVVWWLWITLPNILGMMIIQVEESRIKPTRIQWNEKRILNTVQMEIKCRSSRPSVICDGSALLRQKLLGRFDMTRRYGLLCDSNHFYPLVNVYIANWKITMFHG